MKPKPTLDQPALFQIKVSGCLSANWSEWLEELTVLVECDDDGCAETTLIGTFDQAALLGLLRKLYYLGFPLISVNYIPNDDENHSLRNGNEIM